MQLFSRELALIFKKEVVHCIREPHVLAVTILMPMLIYPIMFIIVSETMLMQQGRVEKTICKVAVKSPTSLDLTYLCKKLFEESKVQIYITTNPEKALREGKVDAVISQRSDGARLEVTLSKDQEYNDILKMRLENAVSALRDGSLKAYTQFEGQPEAILKPPKVTINDDRSPLESVIPVAAAIILSFAISGIASGASYPTVSVLVEERIKQTAQTTMLMPVSHFTLATAKYLAVVFLALVSGVINLISLILVAQVLLFQIAGQSGASLPSISLTTLVLSSLILLFALTLSALSVSAINFLIIAPARSLKEAQSRATLLVLFTSVPAIFSVFPSISLNSQLAWVPLLNIGLLLKAVVQKTASAADGASVVAEVVLSTVLILWIASRQFIFNDSAKLRDGAFKLEPTTSS